MLAAHELIATDRRNRRSWAPRFGTLLVVIICTLCSGVPPARSQTSNARISAIGGTVSFVRPDDGTVSQLGVGNTIELAVRFTVAELGDGTALAFRGSYWSNTEELRAGRAVSDVPWGWDLVDDDGSGGGSTLRDLEFKTRELALAAEIHRYVRLGRTLSGFGGVGVGIAETRYEESSTGQRQIETDVQADVLVGARLPVARRLAALLEVRHVFGGVDRTQAGLGAVLSL